MLYEMPTINIINTNDIITTSLIEETEIELPMI